MRLRAPVSKDEGGGSTSCFETRRSAHAIKHDLAAHARCDAPQHEVGPGYLYDVISITEMRFVADRREPAACPLLLTSTSYPVAGAADRRTS
jgi:hypothetical protein